MEKSYKMQQIRNNTSLTTSFKRLSGLYAALLIGKIGEFVVSFFDVTNRLLLTIFYADDDVVDLPLLILQDADCFYVFYW